MAESNLVLTISDRKQFMRRFSSAERSDVFIAIWLFLDW
jgi:hypothetical protein